MGSYLDAIRRGRVETFPERLRELADQKCRIWVAPDQRCTHTTSCQPCEALWAYTVAAASGRA